MSDSTVSVIASFAIKSAVSEFQIGELVGLLKASFPGHVSATLQTQEANKYLNLQVIVDLKVKSRESDRIGSDRIFFFSKIFFFYIFLLLGSSGRNSGFCIN